MLNCLITSPKKTTTYKNIQRLTIPASSGQAQILPNHAESFFLLRPGNVTLEISAGKKKNILVSEGECYVKNNLATLIL